MGKNRKLLQLLEEVDGLTLVFCETKRRAEHICDFLRQNNIGAVAIHGDKGQADREHALREFSAAHASVLVATDLASRGLDIPNVTHVINLDMPSNIEDYVHRIGRTGRAGNVGTSSTMVNENTGTVLRDLITVLEEAKQEVPKWLIDCVKKGAHGPGNKRGGRNGAGFGGSFGRPGFSGSHRGSRDVRDMPDGGHQPTYPSAPQRNSVFSTTRRSANPKS